ncbi:acyl carrier protein [Duganella sp. CT11-25]|uniref:acyl carrier protein n=1 Tax=unclassified Duganella TaxID=2636909 RepID=UPI0039AF2B3A
MSKTEQLLLLTLAHLLKAPAESLSLTVPIDEQGVDSFLGLRFVRAIQKATGFELDLTTLTDRPTLQELAALIDARP